MGQEGSEAPNTCLMLALPLEPSQALAYLGQAWACVCEAICRSRGGLRLTSQERGQSGAKPSNAPGSRSGVVHKEQHPTLLPNESRKCPQSKHYPSREPQRVLEPSLLVYHPQTVAQTCSV